MQLLPGHLSLEPWQSRRKSEQWRLPCWNTVHRQPSLQLPGTEAGQVSVGSDALSVSHSGASAGVILAEATDITRAILIVLSLNS